MAIETMILAGIGVYMLVMLAIGFYASRGSASLTDFVVAGRKMPLWLCATSIFATWFGSGTMMGAATAAYEGDKLLMVGEPFGSGLALLLSGLLFARMYRRTRRLTWPEIFADRYGKTAGTFAALADTVAGLVWLGGVLFTFGILVESLTGLPMAVGIFSGLLVVTIYTMVGGMWGVALTDLVQMVIFVIGMFILLYFVLDDAGGWGAIVAQLPEGSFNLFPVGGSTDDWIEHIHVWMTLGVGGLAASTIIQRALSARTEQVAQNAFYIAGSAYVLVGLVPLMLGFAATVTLPDLDNPNAVLTELAFEHMHPVFVAVFVGAILSAIMSTSDSILLAAGSVTTTNLLPLFKPKANEKLQMRVARLAIPIGGLLASYVAFNADRVVEVLIDSVAILLCSIFVPFVACFWWKKANRIGALAAIFIGLATWLIAMALESHYPADLIGFLASLISMVVVTLMTQKLDPPRPLTDHDGKVIELKNQLGTLGLRQK